jgi:hypothetical protein
MTFAYWFLSGKGFLGAKNMHRETKFSICAYLVMFNLALAPIWFLVSTFRQLVSVKKIMAWAQKHV